MSAVIYLLRHGETRLNNAFALQGRSDEALNETGRAQARAVGELFRQQGVRFDRVYSSPLIRAVETARLAAGEAAEITVDERLIEMDYGPYEGTSLKSLPPEILTFFGDFNNNPAPAGMEQLSAVVGRLGAFLEDLRPLTGEEENILVSTHAIALKGALEYLTPEAHGSYWSRHIGNCAVFRTHLQDGVYSVPIEYGHADQH